MTGVDREPQRPGVATVPGEARSELTIILLNNTYKILVIIGWEGALTEASNNYDKFNNLLKDNNVPHLKEPYLNWAIRCKQPLADDLHPTMAASETYGETVLYPTLRKLGWLE